MKLSIANRFNKIRPRFNKAKPFVEKAEPFLICFANRRYR